MLILMEWPVIWIVIGVALMGWGNFLMGLGWREWVRLLFDWSTSVVGDETRAEQVELEEMVVEEEVAANPGCGLVLLGLLLVGFGVFRMIV